MLDYDLFLIFSQECNAHYRQLYNFELKKLKLIKEDDIKTLSMALPEEQALVMKSNSLETKRAKLLGEENSFKTFKDIIDEAPDVYKDKLNSLYEELVWLIGIIKEINDISSVIINKRLAVMGREHELDTYDGKGGVFKTNGAEKHTTFNA